MIETYRMLGREHEADLAREAEKRQRGSLVQAEAKRRRPASFARWDSLRRLVRARSFRPAVVMFAAHGRAERADGTAGRD